jgi:membrane dipeptidase
MFAFLGHEDVPVDVSNRRLNGETQVMKRIHIPRYRRAMVKFVVMATGGDQLRPFGSSRVGFRTQTMGALKFMDDMIIEIEETQKDMVMICNAEDFQKVLDTDKIGVIFHLEGGMPLDGNLFMLRTFYRIGLRSMQLGWYFRNELADTGAENSPGGLSLFGRQVVEELNRLGIVIDVSHLSEASVMDVLQISQHPVMASHSNTKAICNHYRNLSDEAIKGIANKNGVIGVVFCPPFVSENAATMDDLIDHIDHIRELTGVTHIAIGPDYIDYAPELIVGEIIAKTKKTSPKTGFPSGLETVEELPNLIKGLKRRGYKTKEIELIMGENMCRLFQQVLK